MKQLLLFISILIGFSTIALANGIKFKQLEIEDAWIKETPPNHPMTGGYLKIENDGNTADVLIGISANFAMKSEIHEMKMEGDVMKMRPLENGLVIPADGEVYLKPGGYHLMFMKLNQQMIPMDVHQVTLTFKNSGSITIPMTVHKMSHGMKHSH
jgi:periplasmic copper chaperone A